MFAGFAAICLAGLSFLAVGLGLEVPGRGGWKLTADFASAEGLVGQADVAVAGVKVGRVVDVSSDGHGGTLVEMRIDDGVRLRSDTRAIVRPKSQLGEKYVLLVRNRQSTAGYLHDGARLPRSQTGAAVEIDDVLNNMDPQARQAFSTTLRQLGVAVNGNAGNINASLDPLAQTGASLRPLAQTAEARQAEISRILTDLNTIMEALAEEQDALGRIVDSGNTAFGAIAARDQELEGTIRQADLFFASLDLTFADLTPADRASLEKAPGTIESGRKMLSLTSPELDRFIPELLLAQVNYPSNQLNVIGPEAMTLAYEWESAFAQRDQNGYAFRFTDVADICTKVRGNPLCQNGQPGLVQPGLVQPGLPPPAQAAPGTSPGPPRLPGTVPGQPGPDSGLAGVIQFLLLGGGR